MIIISDSERTLPEEILRRADQVIILDKESKSFRIIKHRYEAIDNKQSFSAASLPVMLLDNYASKGEKRCVFCGKTFTPDGILNNIICQNCLRVEGSDGFKE